MILTETGNFPTDLYIAQGLADLLRHDHVVRPVSDVLNALGDTVAVLMLTHVDYRTGRAHDMARLRRFGEVKHYPAGEAVMKIGEVAAGLLFVLSGSIEVVRFVRVQVAGTAVVKTEGETHDDDAEREAGTS